jgi:hypothetical protein
MTAVREYSDEAIARVRALYAEGALVDEVLKQTGLSESSLYYWLDGGPADGPDRLPTIPRRNLTQMRAKRRRPAGSRVSVIKRLWRTAEQQVVEIETRLSEGGGDPAGLERDARTLAILAKTVRDLVSLEADTERGGKPGMAHEKAPEHDEEGPRDLDAFRRDLAEKLARLGALEAGA